MSTPRFWFYLQQCLFRIKFCPGKNSDALPWKFQGARLCFPLLTLHTPLHLPAVGMEQALLVSAAVLTWTCHALSWGLTGRWGPSCSEVQQVPHAFTLFSCTEAYTYRPSRSCCLFLFTCILKFLGLPCHLVLLEVLPLGFFCLAFEFCVYLGIQRKFKTVPLSPTSSQNPHFILCACIFSFISRCLLNGLWQVLL